MNVTILTDASWDQKLLVAGYGYWVASDRGKRAGGGPFKNKVSSSNQAEMQACANALFIAIREGLVKEGDSVLFQVDNLHALRVLSMLQPPVVAEEIAILRYFQTLTVGKQIAVRFRHVKGHSNKKDNRFLANNHCDERARKGLRQARQLCRT